MKFITYRVRVIPFCVMACLFVSSSVFSSVLIVSNSQDTGDGSLRATVAAAAADDTIEFGMPTSDPGYDHATAVFTITLTSGEILIDKNLTIAAPPRNIAISGNQASRIFNISAGIVALSDLTLVDGRAVGHGGTIDPPAPGPGGPGNGGAILNQGTLTLTRCTLSRNAAVGGGGGGGLSGSTAGGDGQGGAIANQGTVSLVACTLNDNTALGGPGGRTINTTGYLAASIGGVGSGGAIYNTATWNLSLTNCTIAGNKAVGPDGWYMITATHGADSRGGGIANFGYLTIVHCTVANNAALGGDSNRGQLGAFGPYDGGASSGGGLYCASDSLSGVRDVIFARNLATGGAPSEPPALAGVANGPDVNGAVHSEGHNLLGRSDGAAGFRPDDQQGGSSNDDMLDPMLGELANNGGPTRTLALLPGSPAIDTAALPGEDRDQRYFLRAGPPDVGAFEYQGTQPVMLANISTRLRVRAGDNAMIGGFIITGTVPKPVVLRGIGPSLPLDGLADPIIELHGDASQLLEQNDDWRNAPTSQEVMGSGLQPTYHLESALWETLNPGAYSVVVRGKNDSAGIALFEVYDLDQTVDAKLANVSTRGFVETGDNAIIGGTIIVGSSPRVLFRAMGPSLTDFGVSEALQDPTLVLYDSNGQVIATNDNWRDTQEGEIMATGIAPDYDAEAAIVRDLAPGPYTSVLRGVNDTIGVALIEVYDLN